MSAPEVDPLTFAYALCDIGVPVIVARPGGEELVYPNDWQKITAEEARPLLSTFRPGVDALLLVGGHGVDIIDVDHKDGGTLESVPADVRTFGRVRTPSGGWHLYVVSTGVGKISPLKWGGQHVGDYVGGTVEGAARLLAFLPGSTRPKYPGGQYVVEQPVDLDALVDSEPDDVLVGYLLAAGGHLHGEVADRAADAAAMHEWLEQYKHDPKAPHCTYGRQAVAGLLDDAKEAVPGDPTRGRHGWAMRSTARIVELIKAGCCDADDLGAIDERLREIKPDGSTSVWSQARWAVANVQPTTACGMHGPLPPPPTPAARTLDDVHLTYLRWLGDGYDLGVLDAILATAAVEQLDGDPVWLLVVSGSGAAKTESIMPLVGAGATVASSISSEGALLSATSRRERDKDATGGLLRAIGSRGVLVLKDFTTVISMSRDQRSMVLAALREVYDGSWTRNVGTDGGKTYKWAGRIALVGATTTAYDKAHAVIASMGDRFCLVRFDSTKGRTGSGRQALGNIGSEVQMRAELAEAVGGLLLNLPPQPDIELTDSEVDLLLQVADIVTRARTGVEKDYRGDVESAHDPEMPTRLAKQLGQIVRGGVAVGMTRQHALGVALRVARDTMPPARLDALLDVAAHPGSALREVTKRLQKPRSTVDRTLQELHILGLLEVDDDEVNVSTGNPLWRYTVVEEYAGLGGLGEGGLPETAVSRDTPSTPSLLGTVGVMPFLGSGAEGVDPAADSDPDDVRCAVRDCVVPALDGHPCNLGGKRWPVCRAHDDPRTLAIASGGSELVSFRGDKSDGRTV